jgi:hypothetical protein
MEKEKKRSGRAGRPVGFDCEPDMFDKLKSLSRWLVEHGFVTKENISETLRFLMRRADKEGLLSTPPAWYQEPPKKAMSARSPSRPV